MVQTIGPRFSSRANRPGTVQRELALRNWALRQNILSLKASVVATGLYQISKNESEVPATPNLPLNEPISLR